MSVEVPPIMSENGDIDIHNQQGGNINLSFSEDMSSASVWFGTSNGVRVQLTAGATNNDLILPLVEDMFSDFIGDLFEYSIVDETTSPHRLLLEGQVRVRGY